MENEEIELEKLNGIDALNKLIQHLSILKTFIHPNFKGENTIMYLAGITDSIHMAELLIENNGKLPAIPFPMTEKK